MTPKVSIKSLCTKITSGGTPSRSRPDFFSVDDQGHLWVKSKELQDGVITDTEEKISDSGLKNSSAKYLPADTVLIAMYGANVGQLAWLRYPATVNQAICGLIVDPNKADFRYVFYALKETREGLITQAQGAAQQNLNQDKIKGYEIPAPPLAEQHRIAAILSAYDDLIENNTRRISIFEEMTRRIYEEWFVHFRFPGHEQIKMVESELGSIPKGWRIAELQGLSAYINRGITPKYNDAAAGIVINQKCIRDQKLNLIPSRRQSKPVPKDKLVKRGDVLINSTGVGTLGRVTQVLDDIENCTVDTHVTIVRPLPNIELNWYGMALMAMQHYFEQQGIGATGQTELARGRIAETQLIVPTAEVQMQFRSAVEPIRELVTTLESKNINLRATRDLLLPKLISGEIDVSTLPDPVEANAV